MAPEQDLCCRDCWFHRDSFNGAGECRALPPDQPSNLHTDDDGRLLPFPVLVMDYKRTADALPICGLFRPLVEPEAPPPETKAEKIARLCKGGNVDVAEVKRVLDGR